MAYSTIVGGAARPPKALSRQAAQRDRIAAVRTSVRAFEAELFLLRGFDVQPTPRSGPTALPNDPTQSHFGGRVSTWPWIRNRRQTSRTVERGSSAEVLIVSIDCPPSSAIILRRIGASRNRTPSPCRTGFAHTTVCPDVCRRGSSANRRMPAKRKERRKPWKSDGACSRRN